MPKRLVSCGVLRICLNAWCRAEYKINQWTQVCHNLVIFNEKMKTNPFLRARLNQDIGRFHLVISSLESKTNRKEKI